MPSHMKWSRLASSALGLALIINIICARVDSAESAECQIGPADIVFVMDQSGSVGRRYFQIGLSATAEFIHKLNIGPGFRQIRVGVALFDEAGEIAFDLTRYMKKSELEWGILSINYSAGETNISAGIEAAIQIFRSSSRRTDQGTSRIMIVITDGSDESNIRLMRYGAEDLEITTYVIGILPMINDEELGNATSDVAKIIYIPSYANLPQAYDTICHKYAPVEEKCHLGSTDIMLVIDESNNMGKKNFEIAWNSANVFTDSLHIGSSLEDSRVGAVFFASRQRIGLHLKDYASREDFHRASRLIEYQCGGSDIASAMNFAIEHVFTSPGRRQIMLIITDETDSETDFSKEYQSALKKNISVYAIGITQDVSMLQLASITGSNESTVYTDDYSKLLEALGRMCHIIEETNRRGCKFGTMDLVFVMHHFRSTLRDNFADGLSKIANFTDSLYITVPNDFGDYTRVGFVHFGFEARLGFSLTDYTSNSDVRNAISQIRCGISRTGIGGKVYSSVNIAAAMHLAVDELWHAVPKPSARIILIVTNGGDDHNVKYDSEYASENGASVYAIGVRPGANEEQLQNATGGANANHTAMIVNFTDLPGTMQNMCKQIEEVDPIAPPHSCGCEHVYYEALHYVLDVVFIVDVSSNWTSRISRIIKDFALNNTIAGSNKNPSRLGIVTAGDVAQVIRDLSTFQSDSDITNITELIQQDPDSSKFNIIDALKEATQLFTKDPRPETPKVIVITTSKNLTVAELSTPSANIILKYAAELYKGSYLNILTNSTDINFIVVSQGSEEFYPSVNVVSGCNLIDGMDVSWDSLLFRTFCYANCFCEKTEGGGEFDFKQVQPPNGDLCSRRATCIQSEFHAFPRNLSKEHCASLGDGTYLATPRDEAEDRFLKDRVEIITNGRTHWTGYKLSNGTLDNAVESSSTNGISNIYGNWCPEATGEKDGCIYVKSCGTKSGYGWDVDDCGLFTPVYHYGCQRTATKIH